jgi:hypothetical protein
MINQEILLYATPHLLRKIENPSFDLEIFRNIHNKLDLIPLLIDRSKTIKFPFTCYFDEEYKIPTYEDTNYSFLEAGMKSAIKIADENKKIYILWSGGIDSTFVLCSFLAANVHKRMITVVCNHDSIIEYPWFWNNFIKNKLNYISTERFFQLGRWNHIDGLIFEANPIDGLFGGVLSNMLIKKGRIEQLYHDFDDDAIISIFQQFNLSINESKFINEIIKKTKSNSPRPIKNVYDVFWWFAYNFLWCGTCLKGNLRFHRKTKYRGFFNEIPLQQWVFKNVKPLTGIYSYKKDYLLSSILEYTGDTEYYNTKGKYQSLTKFMLTSPAYMQTNLRMIYNDDSAELLRFYEKDNILTKPL